MKPLKLILGTLSFVFAAVAQAQVWTNTNSMTTARYGPTATLLQSGQVLVAGGRDSTGFFASAELYDPGTGTWLPGGNMSSPRFGAAAVLLPSGKVLVAGGCNVTVQWPSQLSISMIRARARGRRRDRCSAPVTSLLQLCSRTVQFWLLEAATSVTAEP